MRVFAIFGVLLLIASGTTNATQSPPTNSASTFKEKVAFAGITFQGGKAELAARYPYTSGIVSDKKLNRALYKALSQQTFQHIEITPSLLDKTEGHKYALSLVIDNELVSLKKGRLNKRNVYVWLALVSAQLVMFDVESSQLVMSQALPSLQFTDTVFKQPTKQDIRKRIETMLGGIENASEKGLIEHFVSQLGQTAAPAQASLTQFSVGKVTIEDKAMPFIPEELQANNMAVMQRYIAHRVLKSLAQHQNVAIQPYVADGSILTIQGRFSGGEQIYTLHMPEPLYSIDYTLRGFKKSLIERKKAGEVNYYAAFTNVAVQQNSGRTTREIFSNQLKSAVAETQAASFTQSQEWVLFNKALTEHIDLTFSELQNPKSNFFKAQGFSSQQKKTVSKQLAFLEKAYQLCKI